MTILMFLILLLIIGAVVLGFGLTILFGLLGVVFSSIFAAFLFAVKYSLPVLAAAALIALIFRKWDFPKVFCIVLGVGLAVEAVFAVLFFNRQVTVELPPLESIAQVRFSSYGIKKDFWYNLESRQVGDYDETDDLRYLEGVYDEINRCSFKNAVTENVDVEEITIHEGVELLDADGAPVGEIFFYDKDHLCVKYLGTERYYRVAKNGGELNDAPFSQLSIDRVEAEIHETWDGFAAALEESVFFDDGSVGFTIPGQVPGSYQLRTELLGSYRENQSVKTYGVEIQWQVEKDQSWEAGETYRVALGDKTYDTFDLILRVDRVYWEIDILRALPQEYILKK